MILLRIHNTMKTIQLLLIAIFMVFGSYAQEIVGDWSGDLTIQGTKLPLVFHISEENGTYSATMDSPKQGAFGLVINEISYEAGQLSMIAAALGIKFEGSLTGDEISGTFNQGGTGFPLLLSRAKEAGTSPPKRPQTPKEPYPYHSEDVVYPNAADNIQLAGTLTIPKGVSNPTVAILISGSGPQNRDEELMGHRPFLVLADHLTRAGIAVLRYDDRGIGKSKGDFSQAITVDFATDAEAAVQYIQARPEFKSSKIGLIGHSEGGMIAPMVASRNRAIDFVVLLAGPGMPIDELMASQAYLIAKASGATDEVLQVSEQLNRQAYKTLKQYADKPDSILAGELKKVFVEGYNLYPEATRAELGESAETFADKLIAGGLMSPWFKHFIQLDPSEYLSKVSCPVLAMNGSLDLQVPAKENLAAIEKALAQAGNKQVKLLELAGLNHLFQQATTGALDEYVQIEETFNPVALAHIVDWVKGLGE